MRILLITVMMLAAGMLFLSYGMPHTAAEQEPVYTVDATAALPEVTARAWGIYDTQTGERLLAYNPQEVYPIASVTKLMTAAVAFDTLDLVASTTLSWRAVATEGRAGRLATGDVLSVHELLFPLLIESSNDAAEALAEHEERDAFIAAMNAHARELGMERTRYADPSGLSAQNVSNVSDIARLVNYLASERQHLLDVTLLEEYIGTKHTWRNSNAVAYTDAFRGGKHGYTDEANRTLAALFEEDFTFGGTRDITIVLLGSDDLVADTDALRTFVRWNVQYR